MTHVEYLKDLIKTYEEAFAKEPSEDPETKNFREGMIFAWNLAIYGLEHPGN